PALTSVIFTNCAPKLTILPLVLPPAGASLNSSETPLGVGSIALSIPSPSRSLAVDAGFSTAPRSQRTAPSPLPSCGRTLLFWSWNRQLKLPNAVAVRSASMSGLPGITANDGYRPPLLMVAWGDRPDSRGWLTVPDC